MERVRKQGRVSKYSFEERRKGWDIKRWVHPAFSPPISISLNYIFLSSHYLLSIDL
jgi:hypothetical protein